MIKRIEFIENISKQIGRDSEILFIVNKVSAFKQGDNSFTVSLDTTEDPSPVDLYEVNDCVYIDNDKYIIQSIDGDNNAITIAGVPINPICPGSLLYKNYTKLFYIDEAIEAYSKCRSRECKFNERNEIDIPDYDLNCICNITCALIFNSIAKSYITKIKLSGYNVSDDIYQRRDYCSMMSEKYFKQATNWLEINYLDFIHQFDIYRKTKFKII